MHVATWGEPGYEITILAPEPSGGQSVGDLRVEGEFEEKASDGALDLRLVVREAGTAGASVNDDREIAVVAFVPDLAWTAVLACSGAERRLLAPVEDAIGDLLGGGSRTAACSDGPDVPSVSVNLAGSRGRLGIPFAVVGVRAAEVEAFAEDATIVADGVTVGSLTLAAAYGDILVNATTADRILAVTEYGDVDLDAVRAAKVAAGSAYGDVRVAYAAIDGDDALALVTEYGDVDVRVPHGDDVGYRVAASTEYGTVRVRLPGVESDDGNGKDDGTGLAPRLAVPHLVAPDLPRADDRDRSHFKGESEDFGSFADRLAMKLDTRYGDVVAAAADAEDED